MQLKNLMWLGVFIGTLGLQGCTVLKLTEPNDVAKYHSAQEVIDKLKLNGSDGRGREYRGGPTCLNN